MSQLVWFILTQLVLTVAVSLLAYIVGHDRGYFSGRRDGLAEYRAIRAGKREGRKEGKEDRESKDET